MLISARSTLRTRARLVAFGAVIAMVLALMVGAGVGRAAASSCDPFPDVNSSNIHCENIAWLKQQGITEPADGLYHPRSPVSRGSMTAFLFRLTHPGKSSPACHGKPFADVSTSYVFCGYIQWASTHGIAFGYNDGTFGSRKGVTRGAMAAFLHRIATHKPGGTCTVKPFADVPVNNVFCGVITWMVNNGITYGVDNGTRYAPTDVVTRQQMASFLHRISSYIHRDTKPKPKPRQSLRIVSAGFSHIPHRLAFERHQISYAVVVRNPNSRSVAHPYVASDVELNITFTNSKGIVVDSESPSIDYLMPGATMAVGDAGAQANGATHMRVRLSTGDWHRNDGPITGSFTTSGVSVTQSEFIPRVTGRVESTFNRGYKDLDDVAVFYNSDDKVIGGANSLINFVPKDSTVSFKIEPFAIPPEADHTKVYVGFSVISIPGFNLNVP